MGWAASRQEDAASERDSLRFIFRCFECLTKNRGQGEVDVDEIGREKRT